MSALVSQNMVLIEEPECKDYSEEFQCVYHEAAYGAFEKDTKLWGSFVWNMFDFSSAIRDEGGVKARNCKGLVTYDREVRKDSFYYYKQVIESNGEKL